MEHYLFEESYVCQLIRSGCNVVHFRFMNFSMAEWNLAYIIGMLYYFIKVERKNGVFTGRS
ncbi:MAG: hypothetical protein B7Z27_03075 [Sphingobacteriia bacterium 32-37-4]|nr:MAG: hypothetical protein B7Z27_03075 [Sphingobacteriia bacterium 32-37-4]